MKDENKVATCPLCGMPVQVVAKQNVAFGNCWWYEIVCPNCKLTVESERYTADGQYAYSAERAAAKLGEIKERLIKKWNRRV